MKKNKVTVLFLLFCIIFVSTFPFKALSTSWPYSFVVWDDYIYVISEEYVTNIDKEIGEVTAFSDMEQYGGNFSNAYSKGTKYYSITDVDTEIAIAVQDKNGQYIKAIREDEYTYQGPSAQSQQVYDQFDYIGFGIIIFLLAGIIVYSKTRKI